MTHEQQQQQQQQECANVITHVPASGFW